MNGGHDLGGMHGLGLIGAEPDEPVFHYEWQRRIMAMNIAAGAIGKWNLDMSRHAKERQSPKHYLRNSYYENWLAGLEKLLLETGVITAEELADGQSKMPLSGELAQRVLKANNVEEVLRRGGQFAMEDNVQPLFTVGQKARVLNNHPAGHTRAPRYVRGKIGFVERDHGVFVFADENAKGQDHRVPQHIYSVNFSARELWGANAAENDCVLIDLWDGHLEAAD